MMVIRIRRSRKLNVFCSLSNRRRSKPNKLIERTILSINVSRMPGNLFRIVITEETSLKLLFHSISPSKVKTPSLAWAEIDFFNIPSFRGNEDKSPIVPKRLNMVAKRPDEVQNLLKIIRTANKNKAVNVDFSFFGFVIIGHNEPPCFIHKRFIRKKDKMINYN